MKDIPIAGIYFHYDVNGYADSVNFKEISEFISTLSFVKEIGNSRDLPPIDVEELSEAMLEHGVRKVIIAGYSPGMLRPFFVRAGKIAGIKPDQIKLFSFNEIGAFSAQDTEYVNASLYCKITGLEPDQFLEEQARIINKDTLVIGGGIAGIQAALDIANSGHKVFLLEKTGTIGGHMAMFDKTFPTLDCAACILTPKMVEVGQHPNIELLTYSELKGLTGNAGNFTAEIFQKARRVNLSTCIGCGICSEKCPGNAKSEFDSETTMRKAIYIPFPQAVPNKYLIDADSCTYVQKGKCGVCVKVCPADAIDLDEKDQTIQLSIGNIVVASGFQVFDAQKAANYGYGKYPNVLTSLEFERLINASGPTGGNISFRKQDKRKNWVFEDEKTDINKVALIHCVGSRDLNHNKHCSKVCCMYSLKLAHLVKEKLPEAEVTEYYIDMRAFGKGYEAFYERIQSEGIRMIRGKTAKIEEKDGKLLLRSEDMENERIIEQEADMVILSVGLEPGKDSKSLAEILGISLDEDGWFSEQNYNSDPINSGFPGITIAGTCQGPKDIPDTVAHASAAAMNVIKNLLKGSINSNRRELSMDKIKSKLKLED
jgi:heterodisulfide reductase subunit A